MEQSPIVGYLKVMFIGILICVIFMVVWNGSKTEDKIVRLDRSVEQLSDSIREMTKQIEDQRTYLDRLAGANETLLKAIAAGGVRAPAQTDGGGDGTNGGVDIGIGPKKGRWGWHMNAALDADLDPSRPLGTPGRYRNFLKLDPDDPESPDPPPNTNSVFRRAYGDDPKGFNLMVENDGTLSNLIEQYVLSRPGARHKNNPSAFNWKPVLAWRVEISPDFSEYTVHLRHDAYWHPTLADTRIYPHLKGKHPVTAHDFEFSYKLLLDKQANLAHESAYYKDLKGVEVIDDYTFVLRWTPNTWDSIKYTIKGTKVVPKFIYAHDERGNPYPEETVAQEFNQHWYDELRLGTVGCGPYRFKHYERNKYIELERWDDWFGFKEKPLFPIKTLHYKLYTDQQQVFTWLRTGETDIGGLNSTRYREWVRDETDPNSPFKNGDITTELAWTTRYMYIGWKNTDPLFSDKRVRKALALACDRPTICREIWLDRFVPMSTNLWPESHEFDDSIKPLPFDLEGAKKLLDEAGWKVNQQTGLREKVIDGKVMQFKFKLDFPSGSSDFEQMLTHYKNDLLKIGIDMEPQPSQWAQFQKQVLEDRKFRALSLLWVLDDVHHDFKQIWHSRMIKEPQSSNRIEFSNADVDRLQDQLDNTMDPAKRTKIVREIAAILFDEQPYLFFGWNKVYMCHWKHVKNWKEHAYKLYPLFRTYALWIEK